MKKTSGKTIIFINDLLLTSQSSLIHPHPLQGFCLHVTYIFVGPLLNCWGYHPSTHDTKHQPPTSPAGRCCRWAQVKSHAKALQYAFALGQQAKKRRGWRSPSASSEGKGDQMSVGNMRRFIQWIGQMYYVSNWNQLIQFISESNYIINWLID